MKKRLINYYLYLRFILKMIYFLVIIITFMYYFVHYTGLVYEFMCIEAANANRRVSYFLDDLSRQIVDFYLYHHEKPKDAVVGLCGAHFIAWIIGSGRVLFQAKNEDPLNDEEFYFLVTTYAFLYLHYAKQTEALDKCISVMFHMDKRDFLVLVYGSLFFLWAYRQTLCEIAVYEWYAGLWPHDKKMVVGFTLFWLIAYPIVSIYFPEW